MISQDSLRLIAADPKAFLMRSFRIDRQIQIKRRRIDNLRRISTQITTTIKPVSAYTGPGNKVGDCVVEMLALSGEIEAETMQMVDAQRETGEAIRTLISDTTVRTVLEARYLAGLSWEEIAYTMHYAYRWILRLHKRGLTMLKEAAASKL